MFSFSGPPSPEETYLCNIVCCTSSITVPKFLTPTLKAEKSSWLFFFGRREGNALDPRLQMELHVSLTLGQLLNYRCNLYIYLEQAIHSQQGQDFSQGMQSCNRGSARALPRIKRSSTICRRLPVPGANQAGGEFSLLRKNLQKSCSTLGRDTDIAIRILHSSHCIALIGKNWRNPSDRPWTFSDKIDQGQPCQQVASGFGGRNSEGLQKGFDS